MLTHGGRKTQATWYLCFWQPYVWWCTSEDSGSRPIHSHVVNFTHTAYTPHVWNHPIEDTLIFSRDLQENMRFRWFLHFQRFFYRGRSTVWWLSTVGGCVFMYVSSIYTIYKRAPTHMQACYTRYCVWWKLVAQNIWNLPKRNCLYKWKKYMYTVDSRYYELACYEVPVDPRFFASPERPHACFNALKYWLYEHGSSENTVITR